MIISDFGYGEKTDVVPGAYAQYTYTPSYRFTAMAGLRVDRSALYRRTFATPRLHLKWVVTDWMTLRAAAGKGYRLPHALAENHYLLASGRTVLIDSLVMEEAWNAGLTASLYVPLGSRTMTLNVEYYYTDFAQQTVLDFEAAGVVHIGNLDGKSFSHTLQIDANYDFNDELNVMAAFRYNRVMCTYDDVLREKPLTSRYKGLFTLSWTPMMALWHIDLTLQLNGGGRMPTPYRRADGSLSWPERFGAFPQLNAQITRDFRHASVYVGGENLTGYRQPVPVIDAEHPFSSTFEPTMLWGPVHGLMIYAGLRLNMGKDTRVQNL